MRTHPENPPGLETDSTKSDVSDIDQLFEDLASLTELETDRNAFYDGLLSRSVKFSNSSCGVLWTNGPAGDLVALQKFPQESPIQMMENGDAHRIASEPGVRTPRIIKARNKKQCCLIAVPLSVLGKPAGVLTFYRPQGESDDVTEAWLPLFEAIAEIASDFEKNQLLINGQGHDHQHDAISKLSLNAHRYLNSKQVAVNLVNDIRAYVNGDRVGLWVAKGHRFKMLACSGVAIADSRSSWIKLLRPSIKRVLRTAEPLVMHPNSDSISREIQHYLGSFPDEQKPRYITVVPLQELADTRSPKRQRPVGAMVIESFSSQDDVRFFRAINEVTEHAGSAISNAIRYEQIPFRWVWQTLQFASSQFGLKHLFRTAVSLAVMVALVLFLVLSKKDFRVEVRGVLKPEQERQVFAPVNGMVSEILVKHGEIVERDDLLIRLRSPEMDMELQQLDGDIQTNRQKLEGLVTVMKAGDSGDPESVVQQSRLAAEAGETRSLIAGLQTRKQLIKDQLENLEVRSPISGYVITWDVEQLLSGRPVRRGESLLKIADVRGNWKMVLDISDRKYGFVKQAQRDQNRNDLAVTAVLASDPSRKYESRLDEFSMESAVRDNQETSVRVTAPISTEDLERFKPGTSIIGRIHCGTHNVVYVWTADLVNAVKRKLF